ncbi:MAG: hypothetical protein ACTHM6_15855, partial [Tepidisphaeraceae bacterium]
HVFTFSLIPKYPLLPLFYRRQTKKAAQYSADCRPAPARTRRPLVIRNSDPAGSVCASVFEDSARGFAAPLQAHTRFNSMTE